MGNFPFPIPSNPEKFVRWAYCPCTEEEAETNDLPTGPTINWNDIEFELSPESKMVPRFYS